MHKRIRALTQLLAHKFLNSIKRFPEAVIFAIATVALLILMNHWQTPDKTTELLTRIAMTLTLGFPISLSLKVFFKHYAKKRRKPIFIFSLAMVGLIAYFAFLLKEISLVTISKFLAYSLACYLAFVFIPYLSNQKHFELYVIDLFTKFCITYLYSATLYIGLSVILFTIDQLFAIQISGKLYFDLCLVIAGIFAPAYFLAGIPEHYQDYDQDNYPKVLKVLFIYILVPMLSVYTIILFAYFAKIIITRTWPIGLVSHLSLWYAIFSTLLIFCIYPLRKQNRMAMTFSKSIPWLILPLLTMMFISMGKRIEAFGITENRYYVLVAGLWVTAWMLYYCFAKRPRNIIFPITVSIIAVLTVTGPWSSFTISKFSQNSRLVTLLNKYELLEGKSIIPRPNLSREAKREISSVIAYFKDNHSLQDISLLPDDFEIKDMEKTFGFKFTRGYYFGRDDREYFSYQLAEEKRIVSLDGYEVFADFSSVFTNKKLTQKGIYDITYSGQEKVLVIAKDGRKLYSENIANLLGDHLKEQGTALGSSQKPIIMDQNEDLNLRYLFKHVRGWKDLYTGELDVTYLDFYVFIKKR